MALPDQPDDQAGLSGGVSSETRLSAPLRSGQWPFTAPCCLCPAKPRSAGIGSTPAVRPCLQAPGGFYFMRSWILAIAARAHSSSKFPPGAQIVHCAAAELLHAGSRRRRSGPRRWRLSSGARFFGTRTAPVFCSACRGVRGSGGAPGSHRNSVATPMPCSDRYLVSRRPRCRAAKVGAFGWEWFQDGVSRGEVRENIDGNATPCKGRPS